MKGCLVTIGIILGLTLISIASCSIAYSPSHFRFRLKIDVTDGDVVRSGSGVIDVGYSSSLPFLSQLPGPKLLAAVTGNAVTVDLGAKGLLFAIFRVDDDSFGMGNVPIAAYGLKNPYTPEQLQSVLDQLKHKAGWVEVPTTALPTLIHFRNINDLQSAEKVDPSNLAASFGEDVQLKRVTLELTNDPITPVPTVWPEWLKDLKATEIASKKISCGTVPYCLSSVDFED